MIRPTIPADTPVLLTLADETRFFKALEIQALREVLDDYHAENHEAFGHLCVTFEDAGQIAGFAYYAPAAMTENSWYLYWIAVRKDRQGSGIGGRLLRHVEAEIRQKQGRVLFIETGSTPHYEPTRQFYLRHGYEQEAILRDFYAVGDNMVVFRKAMTWEADMPEYIDAHVHVWTPDTIHYRLAEGYKPENMQPRSFTPDELFRHSRPAGVTRINLIQMSFYGFDNQYMLDMIAVHKGVFVGTAVIDPLAKNPEREMEALSRRGVRAFRIHPRLSQLPPARWLRREGYERMFAAAAKHNQAMSCLIDPDALTELNRMCTRHPETPVIIDHLCRIGVDGEIRDRDVDALCALAKHKKVMVKVGAFYALGRKQAPYTDLGPLIQRVIKAFSVQRCMWETDCPFQVQDKHTYRDSIELIRTRLDFLTAEDKDWLLRRTAADFFFRDS